MAVTLTTILDYMTVLVSTETKSTNYLTIALGFNFAGCPLMVNT